MVMTELNTICRQAQTLGAHELGRIKAEVDAKRSTIGETNPRGRMRTQALAQCGTQVNGPQVHQGLSEAGIFTMAFDGIKIFFTQTQQAEVSLQDVAGGDTLGPFRKTLFLKILTCFKQ